MSVGFYGELLFVHELIRSECAVDTEILVVLIWGANVKVFDVNAHVAGSFVYTRYGNVNVNL